MIQFPLVGAMTPGVTDMQAVPAKKRNWRMGLFDKLMPDAELEDQQKDALMRQGLLNAGL
jgi:hypothetical protein